MATIRTLAAKMNRAARYLREEAPRRVAEGMMEETKDNFAKEQYGNDGAPRKWAPRYGYVYRTRRMQDVEGLLRYKKLDYTGRLRRDIRLSSGRGYASLRAYAPYAQLQNEGGRGSGNSFRKPPASTEAVRLGVNAQARPFMGVGQRTYNQVYRLYVSQIRKLL